MRDTASSDEAPSGDGTLTVSVIIPSYGRPAKLRRCLAALAAQTRLPDEVIVCWQADDTPTRDAIVELTGCFPCTLRTAYSDEAGIVAAENAALALASCAIIAMTDDDVVVPRDWIARLLKHYTDPTVGAAGGPYRDFHPDGRPYAVRTGRPVGRLGWWGRVSGNFAEHPSAWRARAPEFVDHLAGGNMSFRRHAMPRFEQDLKPYWSFLELDACMQIASAGYKVVFDYANVADQYPDADVGQRHASDFNVRVCNMAFNHAYILSKHSRGLRRLSRAAMLLCFGSGAAPAVGLWLPVAVWKRGDYASLRSLLRVAAAYIHGWRAAARAK